MNNNIKIIKQIKTRNPNEKVFIGFDEISKSQLLIKTFNRNNHSSYLSFLREKSVNIEHKNINRLVDFYENEKKLTIIREFLNGKDLHKYNHRIFVNKKKKNDFYVKTTIETLKGLKILHQNNIIHRDIRPANLFFNYQNKPELTEPNIKIIDFGMAKIKLLENIDDISPFALIYSPPEQVLKFNDIINETSDIYSLGVSLWSMLTKKLPFNHQMPEIIANLQVTMPLQYNNKITKELYEIIKKATFKISLKKSFNRYSKSDLKQIILEGQSNRYQTSDEMINDLNSLI